MRFYEYKGLSVNMRHVHLFVPSISLTSCLTQQRRISALCVCLYLLSEACCVSNRTLSVGYTLGAKVQKSVDAVKEPASSLCGMPRWLETGKFISEPRRAMSGVVTVAFISPSRLRLSAPPNRRLASSSSS